METVAAPQSEDDLQLLTNWGDPFERSRTRRAAALSVAAHLALITILVLLPPELLEKPQEPPPVERVTPLVIPLTLTQRDPQ